MNIRNALLTLGLGLASTVAMAATPAPAPTAKPATAASTAPHKAKACKKGFELVKGKCEKAKAKS